jgi:D-alanine transaminase
MIDAMRNLAWIDGTTSELADARVSLEDRGYLLGDGVYEVVRVYNGCVFYLYEHLERLKKSAAAVRMSIPYSFDEIAAVAQDLIAKSGYSDAYVYLQLTRGSAARDHLFPVDAEPSMVMYVRPMPPRKTLEEVTAASCITLPDERWMNCHIKTVNLLPNLLARQKASEAGAEEAIMYRPGNIVTEGTRSNIFAVIDGIVRSHPESNLILAGITRQIVVGLLEGKKLKISETAFTLDELKTASEAWLTSTTHEVNPIGIIDQTPLNHPVPGPVTRGLMKDFRYVIDTNCRG